MRILFAFAGGSGHLEPLVPIARAAQSAGHDVAFTGRPWLAPRVEGLGFRIFQSGSDVGGAPKRRPLLPLDQEREELDFRDGFVRRIGTERVTDILALCAEWEPDLIVAEETDVGALIVAERLGLPHLTVTCLVAGASVKPDLVAKAVDEVRAEHGLPPDPELSMLSRYLVLSPLPAGFRDPALPLPATWHGFRWIAVEQTGDVTPPPWLAPLRDRPIVYFTLGTVFNTESGDLFQRVLAGLRDLPVNVVVTVGHAIDPGELGPQPESIHVERYVPSQIPAAGAGGLPCPLSPRA